MVCKTWHAQCIDRVRAFEARLTAPPLHYETSTTRSPEPPGCLGWGSLFECRTSSDRLDVCGAGAFFSSVPMS